MTEFESALVIMAFILFAVFIAILFSVVANWVRDKFKSPEKSKWYKITSGKF